MTDAPRGEPDADVHARPSALLLVPAGLALACRAAAGAHPWDSGELVAAAVRLGGSHAPGQPLHALVGWAAATLFPIGPIAWRLSLFSTLCAVLAAFAAGAAAGELLGERALGPRWRASLTVNGVALGVLLCPPVLRQAVRPEVYALAIALFAWGAWGVVRWARPGGARSTRDLLAAALAAGLSFGVHPPHALGLVLFGLALCLAWRRDLLRSPRPLAFALGFFVAGLSVVAYLPLRAHAGAPMWGDPTSLEGFVTYVTARAYRANLPGPTGAGSADVPFLAAARMAIVEGGLVPLLATAGAGLALLARRARGASVAVGSSTASVVLGGAALVVLLSATLFSPDERIPDHAAYLAPAVLLSLVAGGLALDALLVARPALGGAGMIALALVPTTLPDLPSYAIGELPSLESFAFALVDAPAPRSLALVRTDFVAATWMMDAAVDRTRPDVAAFAEGLATSSWHWRALRGHPACPDGRPARIGDGPGAEPWIRGLLARASRAVPIAAESHVDVARLGWVDGPYVRTPPALALPDHPLRAMDGSGERALALLGTTLRWAPAGDHEVAAEIVRDAVLVRAERLFLRGDVEAARAALLDATAPLPAEAAAPLGRLDAPPMSPLVPSVGDPGALYASAEDAVRVGATMLHAAGRRPEAIALLEAQLDRGDTRAMLQLGWLLLSDGATAQARDIADLFVATSPERAGEALPLMEAIARARP